MISIQGVTKKYGKFIANNDIDFTVEDSQIAILLGPNGAGKSTLIKCITGLLRFDGVIEIDGYDNKSVEAKKLLGYIPEMPAVYDMLTVSEHIEFIMRAYKCDDRDYAERLLERFEMSDKKKQTRQRAFKRHAAEAFYNLCPCTQTEMHNF